MVPDELKLIKTKHLMPANINVGVPRHQSLNINVISTQSHTTTNSKVSRHRGAKQ